MRILIVSLLIANLLGLAFVFFFSNNIKVGQVPADSGAQTSNGPPVGHPTNAPGSKTTSSSPGRTDNRFHGPTGPPHINGPTSNPPNY